MFGSKVLITVIFLLLSSAIYPQQEGDRIIAIVGNEIILESDFQYQVQLYARQNKLTQIPPALAQQIFQQMLTDKIIYAKAVQEGIEVTDDEISRELQYRIESLSNQVGGITALEGIYGMSIGKLRIILRDELAKNLKADKLKRKKFSGGIKVSDREVREFFNTYSDSLPPASEEYELSHIAVTRSISQAEKDEARQKALRLIDSLNNGADFSALAKKYSDDEGSAVNGGNLGPGKRGMFVKNFEDALFSLSIGEISQPVETEFGYHIILLDEIDGEIRTARHILIKYPRLESSDMETLLMLSDVKSQIERGDITFEEAAAKYSQDESTKSNGGYIGFVPVERLSEDVTKALEKISDGQITEPIRIGDDFSYGYEILKRISYVPSHKLNLEQDYDRIKKLASFFKEGKEMEKWVNEMRETIYVDVKF